MSFIYPKCKLFPLKACKLDLDKTDDALEIIGVFPK